LLGPKFKKDAGKIKAALEEMDGKEVEGRDSINVVVDKKTFEVGKECYDIQTITDKVSGKRYVPGVIEPSYGIDRIFYTILEHSYYEEDDYITLKLDPRIAPIKVGVFPLMAKEDLILKAKPIDDMLRKEGLMTYYDDSGSIGRRYARMDEVGTPFCITVDYDTLKDNTVTIRDRDTKDQIRVKIDEVTEVLRRVLEGKGKFKEIKR